MDEYKKDNPFESGSGQWVDGADKEQTQNVQPEERPAEETTAVQPVFAENENKTEENRADNTPPVNPYVQQYFDNKNGGAPSDGEGKKPTGMAIASMVLGIVSLVISACCCVPILGPVITIIAGGVGLALGIVTLVRNGKDGKAIAGVIMSALAVLSGIMAIALVGFMEEFMYYLEEWMYDNLPPEYSPGGSDGYGNIIIKGLLGK